MKKIAILAMTMLLTGCAGQEAPAPATPVEHLATTRQVMLALTIPASEVLFQVGSNEPADDAAWELVEANAMLLGESGNLMLTGPRNPGQAEWIQYARELVATSKAAAEAARRRDVDAVLDAGNDIYGTCEGCHARYMPGVATP